MPENALVSIIIPTYNRARIIKRAVKSVLEQTYTNFELIIIDDGSTDNTAEIINSYKDERVIYIKNNKNSGQTIARNIGLKKAKGEYIAFLDSDDEWHIDYLEKQVAVLNELSDEYGLVYCKCKRLVNNKASFIPSRIIKEEDIKVEWLKENFTTLQAVLLKRQYLKECGYLDERMTAIEDWDFFIRLSNICKFKYNDEILVTMHASADGANDNITNRIMAREYILEKNKDVLKIYPEVLANHFYILAIEYAFLKDRENIIKCAKKALELKPKNKIYHSMLFLVNINVNLLVLYLKLQIKLKNLFK
ncbi:MAG: glycosyltransferase [Candidatus Omnitrophica bacterium]|nr:glycosyltransferase [Candidatus Omnitrophota bacterium]